MVLLEQEVEDRGELVGGLTARAGSGDDPLLAADPDELTRLGRGLGGRGGRHGMNLRSAPGVPGTFRYPTLAHFAVRRGARYVVRLPNRPLRGRLGSRSRWGGDPAGSRGTAVLRSAPGLVAQRVQDRVGQREVVLGALDAEVVGRLVGALPLLAAKVGGSHVLRSKVDAEAGVRAWGEPQCRVHADVASQVVEQRGRLRGRSDEGDRR